MLKMSIVLVFASFSVLAEACDWVSGESPVNQILYPFGLNENCAPNHVDPMSVEKSNLDYDLLTKEVEPDYSNYWDDWILKTESNPFITQHFADNYVGVGVWSPNKLTEVEKNESLQDWMFNHGLQFSVGFGEKIIGEPRLRFDYLWHDKQDSLMMQVEVPF